VKEFARERAAALLEKLDGELTRVASTDPEPDTVHDLRVSIRRFGRCLRAFAEFYPKRARKKIRGKLSGMMELAGAVRDRDIALELIETAGIAPDAPAMERLRRRRTRERTRLRAEAKRWQERGFASRWRKGLAL
jgi:CHAD domain-containing protein